MKKNANKLTLQIIVKSLLLFGLVLVLNSPQTYAKEELSIIQTVSSNQRSLIIAKGMKDGVFKGQEIIFANDNVSIVCRAVEVNRDFSLWEPLDKKLNIPFSRNDVVSINSSIYGNVALEVAGDPGLVPDISFREKIEAKTPPNTFTLKASLSKGLTQSSSSVVDEKNTGRSGNNFGFDYNYRFKPEFEMSVGLRLDNEIYRISDPQLDIPTVRRVITLAATYHFMNFSKNRNYFYISLATGIGQSVTTIDNVDVRGQSVIVPEARIGYFLKVTNQFAMIFETSMESINTSETFDDGTKQTTNSLAIRGTVGIRF